MQPPTIPVQGGIEAALAALLVLRPGELSRNRHFRLHATREGARARVRAAAIRGLARQLAGAHGPARALGVEHDVELEDLAASGAGHVGAEPGDAPEGHEPRPKGVTLRYVLPRVAARRAIHVSAIELSILRVALFEAGVRLLPAALAVRAEDHARVADLLAQARRLRGEGG
jgi:hypothetical protein